MSQNKIEQWNAISYFFFTLPRRHHQHLVVELFFSRFADLNASMQNAIFCVVTCKWFTKWKRKRCNEMLVSISIKEFDRLPLSVSVHCVQ